LENDEDVRGSSSAMVGIEDETDGYYYVDDHLRLMTALMNEMLPHLPPSVLPKMPRAKGTTIAENRGCRDDEIETTQVLCKGKLDDMFCKDPSQHVPSIARPSELVVQLLPHQAFGISWMVDKETQTAVDVIPYNFTLTRDGRYHCHLSK
jgi:hypothetical protein